MEQSCNDRLNPLFDRGREGGVKFGPGRLDGEDSDFAVEFGRQITGQDGRGKGVSGSTETLRLFPVDQGDITGLAAKIAGIRQQNEVGTKAAQGAGEIFGGQAGLEDQRVFPAGEQCNQPPGDQHPGGVVAIQFITDSKQGETSGSLTRFWKGRQQSV